MKKLLRGLGVLFTNYGAIVSSPLNSRKKTQLMFAYTKVIFLHVISKFINISKVNFLNFSIETSNYYFFYRIFCEIFVKSDYYSERENAKYTIIDCGANIGLATIYYKWLWPDASVICFEPDPTTFKYLEMNVKKNKLTNVTLYNKAVSVSNAKIDFYSSELRPGSPRMSILVERTGDAYTKQTVPSVDLTPYITKQPVTILKMDIEGAEYPVLKHLSKNGSLANVEEMHIEYHHNIANQTHTLPDFFNILENEKVSYTVQANLPHDLTIRAKQQDILIKLRRNF